ncbi:hypothetical protein [Crocosphaera chwakensis]|uniref:Uncharacterized protein n=1 Tax=Crocosphaera chwakensis CCY0110 TaxID=391612 RepID=A3IZZ8_9CHRO|nr:hypothetical protein [Crocosphaera chwakensis]EAZ87949.1 hypothetical protein CY0110_14640 [Crocosphaera chwakensis CCY0110]
MNDYTFSPEIINKLTASVNQQYRKFNRIDPTIDKIDLEQEALIWAYLQGLYYTEKDFQFPWWSLRNHLHEYFKSLQKQQGRYLSSNSLPVQLKDFLQSFKRKNSSSPTLTEIQSHFGLSSPKIRQIFFKLHSNKIPLPIEEINKCSSKELMNEYDYLKPVFYNNFKQFLKSFLTNNELLILNAKYQLFPELPVLSPKMISRNYQQQHTRIIRKIRRKMKQEDWKN